ncbi:hypothetical protein EDI_197950 [Entamoeba dispar SAW760]|uniref:Uncharacterized protein n=1 Tax=Entamoeba dispar (strain ATCC PRA-260 / SAW760) TaxID=370354 RepID=B0EPG1_ENTDS|nr:uncharacterized protein EDI_197950 [Entamoeba dispar SAW760]EDR23569.1 hypothetical protein EDI_197950 [Entamoeba dispar SAW760]|eukprot:EDR23569.1 hypothetical protein EDI_197950 [Entamoeba dispar SAW760]
MFEANNLHFPDEFYHLPDCINVIPVQRISSTLVFVKSTNQQVNPNTNNSQFNSFTPSQPFGLQQKTNTVADLSIPANPSTFKQIQMEEEPFSQITDLQQTVPNGGHALDIPETRFTEIEKPAVEMKYLNPVSGEKFDPVDKNQFKEMLSSTFIQTKKDLTSPQPKYPTPQQPVDLLNAKAPKYSPKTSPNTYKNSPNIELSPAIQKKYPKLAKPNQPLGSPSQLTRSGITNSPYGTHKKLYQQASSPVLSPIGKPQIKTSGSTQIKPSAITSIEEKFKRINSQHNTTPIPSVKSSHSIRDDFNFSKPQNHSRPPKTAQAIIEEKKEQPSYPISDYYNSDEDARSRNRTAKAYLQMDWTKKGNLTPLINRADGDDPARIFQMAPIVIGDETEFIGDSSKQQQRRNRSMAWK